MDKMLIIYKRFLLLLDKGTVMGCISFVCFPSVLVNANPNV